jgi:rare lipoprotein A
MKRISFLFVTGVFITLFCAAQDGGIQPDSGGQIFRQEGIASWYGPEFDGRPTASGEIFNSTLLTAAHPTLPFGTMLLITNKHNNRQVTVRVNDRGPFVSARIIDLSKAAAERLDMIATGTAPVLVESLVKIAGVQEKTVPADTGVTTATNKANTSAESPVLTGTGTDKAPDLREGSNPGLKPSNIPPETLAQTENSRPPDSVRSAPVQNALIPAAEIKGGLPPAGSGKLYRLQVGAYKVAGNAVEAFDKLKNAGLNPAYERKGEFYRVVLAGIKAEDVQLIAGKLGAAGFREALIREER